MLLVIVIAAVWLGLCAIVVAACRMAADADAAAAAASARAARSRRPPRPAYNPRRPSTCGTVRSKILTSVHNDQLAT
jgi:hypothetical protein